MDQDQQRALRFVLVVFFLGFNIFSVQFLTPFVGGMIGSEVAMIAIFGAFSAASFFWRLAASIFVLYAAASCIMIGLRVPQGIVEDRIPVEVAIYVFTVFVAGFTALFLLLQIFRNVFHVSFDSKASKPTDEVDRTKQIDLARLFIVTTAIGILVVLFKVALPRQSERGFPFVPLSFLAAQKICSLVPASIVLVRLILFRDPKSWIVNCILILVAIISMLVLELPFATKRASWVAESLGMGSFIHSMLFNVGFCSTLATVLLITRRSGLQLQQHVSRNRN